LGNTGRQRAPLSAEVAPTGERAATEGRPFGRYVLLDDLGRGGMAVVSRAVIAGPRGFSRTVVIKRILAEFSREVSFVNGLATEARLSAMLRHPNIVQVHEFGCVDDEYFLAMEHVDGIDLLQLMKTCATRKLRLPVGAACHVLAEVGRALAYAHALTDADGRPLQIVHRDISPSNIMLTALGEVKLLDFGIAKAADHVRDEHTTTGTLKGKISYLSPEQADGLPVDSRTDIFALGIVFHECLTQHRLFRGQSDFETMRLIREARVAPPSTVAPGIPPELDQVVLRMLAREPADRYQTCDEMLADLVPIVRRIQGDASLLSAFLQELGPLTHAPAMPIPSSMPTIMPTPQPSRSRHSRPAPPPPQSRRHLAFAAVGVAVSLLAVTLWLNRPRREPVSPSVTSVAQLHAPPAPKVTPLAGAPAGLDGPRDLTEAPAAAVSVTHDRVRLSLAGPLGAEAMLDGRLIGTLPIDVELPRTTGIRRLTVHTPGSKPWVRVVAADVDVALKVTPEKLHAPTPRPTHRSTPPAAPSNMDLIKDPFHP
jgi:eukaryotic-like serine/threonine-protein kinase